MPLQVPSKRRRGGPLLVSLVLSPNTSEAFSWWSRSQPPVRRGASERRRRRRRAAVSAVPLAAAATAPDAPQLSPSTGSDDARSSFWYSVESQKGRPDDRAFPPLPCDFDLDRDGRLPLDAYLVHRQSYSIDVEPKPTCRFSVALSLLDGPEEEELEPQLLVSHLQAFLDHGLTSFQLRPRPTTVREWIEANLIGRFRKDTPLFLVDSCQFTVPFNIPEQVSAGSVRDAVFDSLKRMGAEDLDCLQLQYKEGSPYHLDVLDYLRDLQRDGYIRSITGNKLPPQLMEQARTSGFGVASNQIDCNLLDPTDYLQHVADAKAPLFVSNSLAGGLLTDRFVSKSLTPKTADFGLNDPTIRLLQTWKRRRDEAALVRDRRPKDPYENEVKSQPGLGLWSCFHKEILATIEDIAYKHGVSMASVMLRWVSQLDDVASTVVGCRLDVDESLRHKAERPRRLREVFTFSLDAHDMERLWVASGCRDPCNSDSKPTSFNLVENEDERLQNAMERSQNGLYLSKSKEGDSSTRNKAKVYFL